MQLDAKNVRRLHVAVDCALVSLAWVGAYWFRFGLNEALGNPINSFAWYLRALPLVVVPWVFSCWFFGIYRVVRMKTVVDELQTLLRGVALGLLVISSISFFFKEFQFGRLVVLFSAGFSLALQGTSRVAFHRLEKHINRSGRHDVPALILGTGTAAIRLLQKLQDHPETGYRVIGFLDDDPALDGKDVANRPVLGRIDDLNRVATEHAVQEVFVAVPSIGHTRMLSMVLEAEELGLNFRVVTNLFEVLTAGTPIDLVDDLPLVQLGRERVSPIYEPMKRIFDVCGAIVGLVVFAPLILWSALRVRMDSPGPAFLAHERVGRRGERFRMYKLRTMTIDTDPNTVAPRDREDARVTRYGRWLRSTSIDELPQLWNVLRGEMSIAGPRPEMPFIVASYDNWQRHRLAVKPGITGLWQILGRKDLPMHQNLQYDFYYIRNRSLALDLSIVLRTFGAVLTRRGAF
jgi:exopolysaccharide biosynthesis polyprenyl glycosylphosphotransferase